MKKEKPTHRYYKGGEYTVLDVEAYLEDTLEPVILYKGLSGITWVRSEKSFNELILVNGKIVPKFKKIDE